MGLQTLDRAMTVLHALGAAGAQGLRFVDLHKSLELSKPTMHRMLAALASHGLIELQAEGRRYRLGTGLQALAWSVPADKPDLPRICAPSVQCLAEESGDTVFLSARDGLFTVCLSRATGDYPIRAITVDVGSRRPLGIGAGGLAILGALPEPESERVIEALQGKIEAFPLAGVEQIRKSQRLARRNGYALSDEKVAEGVRAVGVAIHDRHGAPIGAIGLAAIRQRVSPERLPVLVALLQREQAVIEKSLNAGR